MSRDDARSTLVCTCTHTTTTTPPPPDDVTVHPTTSSDKVCVVQQVLLVHRRVLLAVGVEEMVQRTRRVPLLAESMAVQHELASPLELRLLREPSFSPARSRRV